MIICKADFDVSEFEVVKISNFLTTDATEKIKTRMTRNEA